MGNRDSTVGEAGDQGVVIGEYYFFYNWPQSLRNSTKLTFYFQTDSSSTFRDSAETKGGNDFALHSVISSMFLPRETMDFSTEYWEKCLL